MSLGARNSSLHIPVLGIIGVGLIGGSFSLILKNTKKTTKVLGVGRDPQSLSKALELGLIDEVVELEQMAQEADVIVIATPVQALAKVLERMLPYLRESTILTDVGSTKTEVIQVAREVLGERIQQFVPGHPIAGSHASGPTAARLDLFLNRNVILTPLPENNPADVDLIVQAWRECGAHVQLLDRAENHDEIFAAVSHFPHFLASCYMSFMDSTSTGRQALTMGGTGFRDFTRIAAGSPEMWRDIFMSNRAAMLNQLAGFKQELERTTQLLSAGDEQQIYEWLKESAIARRNWKEND